MRNLTMRSMIAVAALAVAAASASAQTYTAKVPMSFHAGDKQMAAGSYEFRVTNTGVGSPMISVRNVTTSSSAILVAAPGPDVAKAWKAEGKPVLAFECLGSNCALTKLWNASSVSTYSFPGLKVRGADAERIASITVALTKGD